MCEAIKGEASKYFNNSLKQQNVMAMVLCPCSFYLLCRSIAAETWTDEQGQFDSPVDRDSEYVNSLGLDVSKGALQTVGQNHNMHVRSARV